MTTSSIPRPHDQISITTLSSRIKGVRLLLFRGIILLQLVLAVIILLYEGDMIVQALRTGDLFVLFYIISIALGLITGKIFIIQTDFKSTKKQPDTS